MPVQVGGKRCRTYILATDGLKHIIGWASEEFGDDGELIDVILAREEGFALEHLGEDAAGAPDVHLDVVLLPREHDLGGAVIPRRNVARHLWILNSGQAKVADLQIAILVNQDVARLQVTVDHAGRMYIFEAALRCSVRGTSVRPVKGK